MLPIIGGIGLIGNLLGGLGGKEEVKEEATSNKAVLDKALQNVAKKDPAMAKELAFALSEAVQTDEKTTDDGEMPKELKGLLKGAVDMFAGMIPGGGFIKGVLGKIF